MIPSLLFLTCSCEFEVQPDTKQIIRKKVLDAGCAKRPSAADIPEGMRQSATQGVSVPLLQALPSERHVSSLEYFTV